MYNINMRKFLCVFISTLILLCSLCFMGCKESYHSYSATYFNTQVLVQVKSKNFDNSLKEEIDKVLEETDNSLSINKQSSHVFKFNSSQAGDIETDAIFIDVLKKSKELNALTLGKYNPAVYPISRLWKLSADTYLPTTILVEKPSESDIISALNNANAFNEISFENTLVKKPNNNLKLDFGGIAKGYAVDKIKNILSAQNFSQGYVNVGGSSIFVIGVEEDLKIMHPRKSGEHALSVKGETLKGKSLSTSGDYVRFYKDETGKYYSHIIDTLTGAPIDTGFQSITVIGDSACDTDAISTAIASMNKAQFIEFVNATLTQYKIFAFYEKNGEKLFITNEKQDNFTLLDESYSIFNI